MRIREIIESRPISLTRSIASSPGRIKTPSTARTLPPPEPSVIKSTVLPAAMAAKQVWDIDSILGMIAQGNWQGAVLAGAITALPQLKAKLTPAQFDMLTHAANVIGAKDAAVTIANFAAKQGLPYMPMTGAAALGLGLMTYSPNAGDPGEEAEVKRRQQMKPEITKPK